MMLLNRLLLNLNVAALLDPCAMVRDDGKRPDGMPLVPWKRRRALVWDATSVDTLALSHLSSTAFRTGVAASTAEYCKRRKYFIEIAKDLAYICAVCYRDACSVGAEFAQKISIAIQRGNTTSILATYTTKT